MPLDRQVSPLNIVFLTDCKVLQTSLAGIEHLQTSLAWQSHTEAVDHYLRTRTKFQVYAEFVQLQGVDDCCDEATSYTCDKIERLGRAHTRGVRDTAQDSPEYTLNLSGYDADI